MFIKICGVTTVSDALLAAQLGATHIGLNFYPRSLRALSSVQAWEISSALHTLSTPPILVGVFVNESVPIVRHILQTYQLDLAQLSGDEPDEDLFELGSVAFKVYRPSIGQTLLPARTRTNPALLLDAPKHGDHYGGSGKITDWAWASTLARQYPLFLAGGLTAANVATAIQQVHPWGIDVASGVESTPGVKSAAKMQAFIKAAQQAWG
jgi:phosphoribosylanthranilate isomerase